MSAHLMARRDEEKHMQGANTSGTIANAWVRDSPTTPTLHTGCLEL